MNRMLKCLVAIALVALLAPLGALADTHIVELVTSGDSESTSEVWFGADRMAMVADDTTVIYRGDLKKLYLVRHEQKSTLVIDLPFDMASIMPPQMAQMMEQMVPEVTVTPTDETRTIAGYKARRFDVSIKLPMGGSSETKVYVSKEVPIDWTLARQMSDEMTSSMQPQMKALIEKMSSIEGYQLGSEAVQNVMGQTMSVTKMTQSIEEKDAPDNIYEPPGDYEQKPFNMQTLMQMQQGG